METQIVMTHESHDPEIKEMSKEWKCLPEKLLLPFYDCLMTTSLARKIVGGRLLTLVLCQQNFKSKLWKHDGKPSKGELFLEDNAPAC
jgi:hypothetical protein